MSQRRNWSEYNAGLKQRGSLTFWIEPAVLDNWIAQEKAGRPEATITYTNQAIVTMVSLKSVFGLPGRSLCGFVKSVFKLINNAIPHLPVRVCGDVEGLRGTVGNR